MQFNLRSLFLTTAYFALLLWSLARMWDKCFEAACRITAESVLIVVVVNHTMNAITRSGRARVGHVSFVLFALVTYSANTRGLVPALHVDLWDPRYSYMPLFCMSVEPCLTAVALGYVGWVIGQRLYSSKSLPLGDSLVSPQHSTLLCGHAVAGCVAIIAIWTSANLPDYPEPLSSLFVVAVRMTTHAMMLTATVGFLLLRRHQRWFCFGIAVSGFGYIWLAMRGYAVAPYFILETIFGSHDEPVARGALRVEFAVRLSHRRRESESVKSLRSRSH